MYEASDMPDEPMNASPDHHKRPAEIKIHPHSPDSKKAKLDRSPPFVFGQSPARSVTPSSKHGSLPTPSPTKNQAAVAYALKNEPIFRSNHPPYLHPFFSACQVGIPVGDALVDAAKKVLGSLETSYTDLERGLRAILEDGWLGAEWQWLETASSPDQRACMLYERLWDTGFYDRVVEMGSDEAVRRALSHAFGAVVKVFSETSPLWMGMEEDNLRGILAEMHPIGDELVRSAIEDLRCLHSSSPEAQEGCQRTLILKWQRADWENGVWMGEFWTQGASLEALQMIAQIINVHFVGHGSKWKYDEIETNQPYLHYLRLVLGAGRFSLEEWAPILRLFRSRDIRIVRDTLFGIGECTNLVAIRRRWGDILAASIELHRPLPGEPERFFPLLLPTVTMNESETARFLADLDGSILRALPRGLQVRLIGRHFGSSYAQEIDWAYFSEFLIPGSAQEVHRQQLRASIVTAKQAWTSNKTDMLEFFQHFALDNGKLKLMSLRTAYAVRTEDYVWSGPVRSAATSRASSGS